MAKMAGYTTAAECSDEIKYQQKSCRHRFGNVAKGGHYMLLTRTKPSASKCARELKLVYVALIHT